MLESEANELVDASESIRVSQSLKARLLTHNRNSFLYHLHQDPVRFESKKRQREEIQELLKSAEGHVSKEEERIIMAEVKEEIADYLRKREEHEKEAISPLERYNLISQDVDSAIVAIDRLIAINRSHMSSLTQQVHQQNRKSNRLSLLVFGLGIVLVSGVMIGVFLLITRPLATISQTISNYKEGNLKERVDAKGLNEVQVIASNFNSMADWLEEKRQDQLRFIASIAHDLRNPLNSMSMASEVLMGQSQEDARELSKIIFHQVRNLDRLVGDLLDTTRIEAGQFDLNLSENDIGGLIKNAVGLHQTSSNLHEFQTHLPTDPLLCKCDSSRLSQVLNNLLSNAIKYSPNGGTITIKASLEGDEVQVSISDQGIGIEPQDMENIFRPFHRAKNTRNAIPGIGLGLSASRRIIEAHKGRMWVASTSGKGSTFYIALPLK